MAKKKKPRKLPGTKAIAQLLCKMEAGKVEVNVAQMQECVTRLADLIFGEGNGLYQQALYCIGRKRNRANKARS